MNRIEKWDLAQAQNDVSTGIGSVAQIRPKVIKPATNVNIFQGDPCSKDKGVQVQMSRNKTEKPREVRE